MRPNKLRIGLYGNLAASLFKEVEDALLRKGVSCCVVGGEVPADLKILCSWPDESGDPTMFLNAVNQFQAASVSDQGMIVIEAPDPLSTGFSEGVLDAWNGKLKALADDLGAHFVPIRSKFLRWGPKECLAADFNPSKRGVKSIANAIAKLVVREQASASISDEEVTLTCGKTGQSLSKLLETDPAAADELLVSMCSTVAEVWPGFFWDSVPLDSGPSPPSRYDLIQTQKFQVGIVGFPESHGWPDTVLPSTVDIDWRQTGPDRSWQSMFLGLDFLVRPLRVVWILLMDNKVRSSESAFLNVSAILGKAIDIFLDFQRCNPPHAPVTPRAWHEGTATRRVQALLALLSCCLAARKRLLFLSPGVLSNLGLEISRSAELLSSATTYIEAGNHGVRQDSYLYTMARAFVDSREADNWRAQALERLEQKQFMRSISADGVWLEHSTGYHSLVLNYLFSTDRVALLSHDEQASDLLRRNILRMLKFFDLTLLPNQIDMMIGDTGAKSRIVSRANAYPRDERKLVGMFPDAGYMICRPPAEKDETGLHLAFYANLKSSKHKQADDLSIFLQEGLTPWLVDGGSINKETSDPRRNAARFDPGAHSTYRVNGGGYSFNRRSADEVGFIATHEHDDWCGACAVNRLYEGGEVTRSVVYIAEYRLVVVIDHLLAKGDGPALFEQFWHLAPGTVITQREGGFLAVQEGHPTRLHLAVDSAADDSWDQWEGGDGQPLGWTMTGWNQVVPNRVLRRTLNVRRHWCVMALHLSLARFPPSLLTVSEIKSSENGAEVYLCMPGNAVRILFDIFGAINIDTS